MILEIDKMCYNMRFGNGSVSLPVSHYGSNLHCAVMFARIHTSSLIKTGKTLNRPITKFYNGDDVNVIAAELRLAKTRPTSFNKKHNLLLETMPTDVNRVLKTKY